MSALDEFDRGYKAGWAGLPLAKGESAAVKAAHRAARRDRADHDYWLLRGEQKEDKA